MSNPGFYVAHEELPGGNNDQGTVHISYDGDDDVHYDKIQVHGLDRHAIASRIVLALNNPPK